MCCGVIWAFSISFVLFCFVFRSVFLVIEGGTLGLPGTVQQILISFSYYFFKSSDCFYIQKIKFEQYDNRDTRMPTRFLSTRFLMDTSVRFSSKEQFWCTFWNHQFTIIYAYFMFTFRRKIKKDIISKVKNIQVFLPFSFCLKTWFNRNL